MSLKNVYDLRFIICKPPSKSFVKIEWDFQFPRQSIDRARGDNHHGQSCFYESAGNARYGAIATYCDETFKTIFDRLINDLVNVFLPRCLIDLKRDLMLLHDLTDLFPNRFRIRCARYGIMNNICLKFLISFHILLIALDCSQLIYPASS